eukprot:m.201896 g.201896  ORF g.201896 m.201896 type:complete len:361 (+) comp14973_c3_seq2:185-1267(+)
MTHSFLFQYIAAPTLFLCGLAGCYIPRLIRANSQRASTFLQAGQSIAAGVFVAAGLMHLLPDAVASIPSGNKDEFPFVFLAVLCGFVLVFLTDFLVEVTQATSDKTPQQVWQIDRTGDSLSQQQQQLSQQQQQQEQQEQQRTSPSQSQSDTDSGSVTRPMSRTPSASSLPAPYPTSIHRTNNGSVTTPLLVARSDEASEDPFEDNELVKLMSQPRHVLVTLFVALSVHSIIAGLALGTAGNNSTAWAIFAAIIAHKVLAAFALGHSVTLSTVRVPWKQLSLFVAFSITTPLGIIIGALSHIESEITTGYIKAVAAGTFLFLGASHLAIEMKRHAELAPAWVQAVCYLLGTGLMTMLAKWT